RQGLGHAAAGEEQVPLRRCHRGCRRTRRCRDRRHRALPPEAARHRACPRRARRHRGGSDRATRGDAPDPDERSTSARDFDRGEAETDGTDRRKAYGEAFGERRAPACGLQRQTRPTKSSTPVKRFALALALLVASSTAYADEASVKRSGELKEQGYAVFDQGKYADAYALYVQAYSVEPTPSLLYNQGRALEAMGEYPDAIAKLEDFRQKASPEMLAKVPAL